MDRIPHARSSPEVAFANTLMATWNRRPMSRTPEHPIAMASTQPEVDRFIDRAVIDCRLEPMPPARPPRDPAALWNAAKAIERRLCRLGAENPVPIVTADVCRKLAEDALDAYDNALAAK